MSISEQSSTSEDTLELVYLTYDRPSSKVVTSELEKAGYRTTVTSSIGETILCMRQPRYVALIVGPLVQAKDKTLLASELKRRKSATKLVFLSRDGGHKAVDGIAGPDAVLSMTHGADSLVRTLKKLLATNKS